MPFPIETSEIAKTEAKLGVTFPDGFKLAMAKNNGGEIKARGDSWQMVPFLDTSDKKRLVRTCNDIIRETKAAREWSGFPPAAFVIAQGDGGDLLVLLPLQSDPARLDEPLYHWNHETSELVKVACGLADFRQ